MPVKPLPQTQTNFEVLTGTQRPLFWQGLALHGSTRLWHVLPVSSAPQTQLKSQRPGWAGKQTLVDVGGAGGAGVAGQACAVEAVDGLAADALAGGAWIRLTQVDQSPAVGAWLIMVLIISD
jgi:hypothetical protein